MSAEQEEVVAAIVGFVRRRSPAIGEAGGDMLLLVGGPVDSLGLIELMEFLQKTYNIEIADEDFSEDNFRTIGTLAQLVELRRGP